MRSHSASVIAIGFCTLTCAPRGQRRDRHRLVQWVRCQDLDQVEVGPQEGREVAGRQGAGMLGGAAGQQGRVALAQSRDLRLRDGPDSRGR